MNINFLLRFRKPRFAEKAHNLREGTEDFCLLAMAKIDGSAISKFTSILRAASGGKGECDVFYNGEPLKITSQRKNRTQSRPFFKAAATPKFFLKITENLRTLFANFRELKLFPRAREITLSRRATQFADTSAYGKGETAALKFCGHLKYAAVRGKPFGFPLQITKICFCRKKTNFVNAIRSLLPYHSSSI